jgi:glycolate oxidase
MIPDGFADSLAQIVGASFVRQDEASLEAYGVDALKQAHRADLVALPGSVSEVAAVAELCSERLVPLVVRGAGTGQTGGSVPLRGGVVLSLERLDRILEIDQDNLLAVVEPHVRTGDLQEAVERVGLFYPPDPASLKDSVIGGNVAENAGGPRAFKYGTTRQYVLGLEAVLPTGEIIRTGSKAVKNVVGYDLTRLLVGSEGTLAIITQVVLRLIPRPPARVTVRASFDTLRAAVDAVSELLRARVVPATLELIDGDSLDAVHKYLHTSLAPPGTGAVLLIEVDGLAEAVAEESRLVEAVCQAAGATEVMRARDEAARDELWRVRRELSPSLRAISEKKLNNDVVVPRGRVPQLFDLVEEIRRDSGLRIACFGHAGDGNIHVNILLDPSRPDAAARGERAVRTLLEGVVALEGSISCEHGIGFSKAPYLSIELSPTEISVMKRIKQVFDPHGILNPGKIFGDRPE